MPESPLIPSQNALPLGRGATFCEKLWGPPHPTVSTLGSLKILLPFFVSRNKGERKDMKVLRENNREMELILASLKVPQVEVLILVRPISHLFEDLISELLLILCP